MSRRLLIVRVGVRSGSATSIRDALGRHVDIVDLDLQDLVREPRLAPARLRAEVRARRQRGSHSFTKTGIWTRAVEGFCMHQGPFAAWSGPILFTSTLPAWVEVSNPYTIYTDRVFSEGRAAATTYSSTADPKWAQREKVFVQRAHFVASAGPSTTPFLIRDYELDNARTTFVGSGPNSPLSHLGRHGTRRPDEPIRLLFMGRQWELHGGPVAVEAARRARLAGTACTLTVAGCAPKALPEWVQVEGEVSREQAGQLVADHDIYLRPSMQDAFPVAVQEALLSGVPVIGTKLGNQEWMIGHGGLVTSPGDSSALSDAIARVANDLESFKVNARNQAQTIGTYFNWDETAKRLLSHIAFE